MTHHNLVLDIPATLFYWPSVPAYLADQPIHFSVRLTGESHCFYYFEALEDLITPRNKRLKKGAKSRVSKQFITTRVYPRDNHD